jgi:hypothetical protein
MGSSLSSFPSERHPYQAAEKLDFDLFCNKGTTLVGPQMQQNKGWALAPAAFLPHNRQYLGISPQPVQHLRYALRFFCPDFNIYPQPVEPFPNG